MRNSYSEKFVLAGLCVLAFLMLSLTVGGQTAQSAVQPNQTDQLLQQKLESSQSGEIKLIVQLDIDSVVDFNQSKQRQAEQINRVQTAQAGLLAKLPAGSFTPYAQYKTIPFMALKVNQAGLDALSQLPEVVHIHEDVQMTVSLAGTIPVIGADEAWAEGYTGEGQTVVIIDTGVDGSHPFFQDRLVAEACFSNAAGDAISLCPNGQSSQTGAGASDPTTAACVVQDTNMCVHGTHVAGIAAGKGDAFSGVAPDSDIIGIQVFSRIDSFECILISLLPSCITSSFSDIVSALEYVYTDLSQDHAIASINMSIGGEEYNNQATCDAAYPGLTQIIDQLNEAGIATVVASGNNGWTSSMAIPGCVSGAIGVGATNDDDTVASYSNIHPMVDLLAPGSQVNSSIPGGTFQSFDGTSMAAPHVAGAWAVMKQIYPNESVSDILDLLASTGKPIQDQRSGGVTTVPRIDLGEIFGPNLDVEPELLEYSALAGETAVNLPLTFGNSGQSDLAWSLFAERKPAESANEEVRLTHSTSRDVIADNSLACDTGQSYFRVFDLPTMGVTDPYQITSVEFGVEASIPFIIFPPAVDVRLYTLQGETLHSDNLTLLGEANGEIESQSLAVISAPISQIVPAGSKLVVELYNIETALSGTIVFGSNKAGQTGPTYYQAPTCGVNEIADLASIGHSDIHLVMELVGKVAEPPPVCNEWVNSGRISVAPNSGTITPDNQTELTVAVDLDGLDAGEYLSHICFNTNTAADSIAYVPVSITIPCPQDQVCEPTLTPTPEATPAPTASPEPTTPAENLPVAKFSALPTQGTSPLAVQFTNQSTGVIDSTIWEFGDGSTSTALSPSHTYLEMGTFTAKLTVSNGSGSSSFEREIRVFEAIQVDFEVDQRAFAMAPAEVTFTNLTVGQVNSCTWDFGDGTRVTDCGPNVLHTYSNAGEYTVSLSVTGVSGSASASKGGYVTVAADDPSGAVFYIYLPLLRR